MISSLSREPLEKYMSALLLSLSLSCTLFLSCVEELLPRIERISFAIFLFSSGTSFFPISLFVLSLLLFLSLPRASCHIFLSLTRERRLILSQTSLQNFFRSLLPLFAPLTCTFLFFSLFSRRHLLFRERKQMF